MINDIENTRLKRKLPDLPYVTSCGHLESLECQHVVVNKCAYNFNKVSEAVDFAYKFFFLFRQDFPITCPYVWSFFQKVVYNMERERRICGNTQIVDLKIMLK